LVTLILGRCGARPPLFTASFSERSHDESALAKAVATKAGLPIKMISIEAESNLENAFRSVVFQFDGQCADTGALGFYQLCATVRRSSTVVLSGDGGDEFFGGYETYRATRFAERVRHLVPAKMAGSLGRLAYYGSPRKESRLPAMSVAARFFLGLAEGGASPHMQWRRLVPGFLLGNLYDSEMTFLLDQSPYREYENIYKNAPGGILDRALIADQSFHLQSVLTKVDAMSMAHGLEIRVPLLDRRVMDLAGKLSVDLLLPRRGRPKHILRLLAERLGAPAQVTRAPKRGFNFPIARLLRRDLSRLAEHMLAHNADVLAPYLKPEVIRRMWQEHQSGRADHAFALWPILTIAVWRGGLARPEGLVANRTEAAA
jgi:asparagine synthase (glutamine-hydrolysing)